MRLVLHLSMSSLLVCLPLVLLVCCFIWNADVASSKCMAMSRDRWDVMFISMTHCYATQTHRVLTPKQAKVQPRGYAEAAPFDPGRPPLCNRRSC